jgi:hypothetical protein
MTCLTTTTTTMDADGTRCFSKTKLFDLVLQCVRGVGRRPQDNDDDDFDFEAGGNYCCNKNCFKMKVVTTDACSHKSWFKQCRCQRRKSI